MDQRKLMDNANTITDMAKVCTLKAFKSFSSLKLLFYLSSLLFQTQNSVYELVSDMSQKQEVLEERIVSLEERLGTIHEQLDNLPEILNRVVQSAISAYRLLPDSQGHPGEAGRHTHLHPNDASFGRPSWSVSSLTGTGGPASTTPTTTRAGTSGTYLLPVSPQPGSLDTS